MAKMNNETRCRLMIDFPRASNMVEWFQRAWATGLFGTVDMPGWEEHFQDVPLFTEGLSYTPQKPRPDVGIRQLDGIDSSKVTGKYVFIVANTNDGGRFIEIEEGSAEKIPVLNATPVRK